VARGVENALENRGGGRRDHRDGRGRVRMWTVSYVLEYDGHCPMDGSMGIELKHEPDDAVYCLDIV
jgi:hypothetical protein